MTLPHVDLGNTYNDVGQGVSSFIKGLVDQRNRQAQLTLQEAMAKARMLEATKPDMATGTGINPATGVDELLTFDKARPTDTRFSGVESSTANQGRRRLEQGDERLDQSQWSKSTIVDDDPTSPTFNKLIIAFEDKTGREPTRRTRDVAPTYTMQLPTTDAQGNPQYEEKPRGIPGAPTMPIALSPGSTARQVAPAPMTAEIPGQGPTVGLLGRQGRGAGQFQAATATPGGAPLQPKGTSIDNRKASDAFRIVQANAELQAIYKIAPEAYQEAASFIASKNMLEGVPIVGPMLEQIVIESQNTLSPEAAQIFRAWTQAASSVVFGKGGAALTRNETQWASDALGPRIADDPSTAAQRDRLLMTELFTMTKGNPAWLRYRDIAKAQFNFSVDDTSQIAIPTPVPPKPPSPFGYSKP